MGPYLAQTPVTLDLLKEAGYKYMLDWPADDQPFWMRTRSGPLLSIPYSIELNDSPVLVFRQEAVADFEKMIVDQFEELLLQSRKWPLVYSLVTPPVHHRAAVSAARLASRVGAHHEVARPDLDHNARGDRRALRKGRAAPA